MESSNDLFTGTREVTCNIFAMYAQKMITLKPEWSVVLGTCSNISLKIQVLDYKNSISIFHTLSFVLAEQCLYLKKGLICSGIESTH